MHSLTFPCSEYCFSGLEIKFFVQVPAGDKKEKFVCQIKNFGCYLFFHLALHDSKIF